MSSAIGPGLLDGLSALGHQLQAQGSWLQVRHAAYQMHALRCRDLPTAGSAHCEHTTFGRCWPSDPVTAGLLTQAIKCFEAVVQAGVGTQPPAAQAAARLALARLLLAHTHNVAEARQHLERAVRAGSYVSATGSACVVMHAEGRLRSMLICCALTSSLAADWLEIPAHSASLLDSPVHSCA